MAGKLIIISAPSGTGKTTIVNEVMKDPSLRLQFSISATTRPPRGTEQNGVEYYFLSVDEFRREIEADAFAEYEEVYPGRYYGTLKREIARINEKGSNAILDVDVMGGLRVKRIYGDHALAIFIAPPSIATLRERLERRGTDSPEEIAKRIAKAEFELAQAPGFDHRVVNDVLSEAVSQVHQLIADFMQQ